MFKLALVLLLSLGLASCLKESGFISKHPDKVLFNRAMSALKARRFDVAAIDFRALINTYPNSNYAAMAKIAF